jgi:Peptidase propeptide and YPEB domain
MNRLGIFIGAMAAVAFAGTTLAHEESRPKQDSTQEQRISPSDMKARLNDLGYDVQRIEAEHGKFEARLVERRSGRPVEATFSARTGELVRAKLES